jgi:quinol-cytochrome oxidoreductase complex cytochrome b subunit
MLRDSQIWKSIFRHPAPTDRQGRVRVMVGNFLLHLHPTSIKQHALRPSFTWCMGGITFLLFLVETVTGVLLMFYYRPTIEWAYHDMLDLRDVVSFGIVREIHRWGAHAMVITVMLHMYRVGANRAGDARFLLLGARSVGEETLNRFYVLHCIGLPLAALGLMGVHFWRVRKDGISGPL